MTATSICIVTMEVVDRFKAGSTSVTEEYRYYFGLVSTMKNIYIVQISYWNNIYIVKQVILWLGIFSLQITRQKKISMFTT